VTVEKDTLLGVLKIWAGAGRCRQHGLQASRARSPYDPGVAHDAELFARSSTHVDAPARICEAVVRYFCVDVTVKGAWEVPQPSNCYSPK